MTPGPIRPAPKQFDSGPLSRTNAEDWCFQAAQELRDTVRDLIDEISERGEWKMRPGEFENIFIGTFARGTKTYQAALLLCDRGCGEQAAMLNRSLFEYMVTAWWMLLQDDEDALMGAFRRHRDHARVLYERASEQHPELELAAGEGEEPLSDEYITELDEHFGSHGGQWHRKRLDQLVREVEEGWDEPYSGVLWKFFRFVNHWNNYLLHHSSIGVIEGVRWEDEDEQPEIILGPRKRWVDSALWAAFWSYGLLVLATLRRLSPERADAFRKRLEELAYRFIEVTADMARGVGRNDPCPCGSEKKFKTCHEDYLVS
jgi:hypothetical protein